MIVATSRAQLVSRMKRLAHRNLGVSGVLHAASPTRVDIIAGSRIVAFRRIKASS
jgi:hypothetical protein